MKSMIGSNVQYRPITLADFVQFYGQERSVGTISGFAFFVDGELSGVAGVEIRKGYFYAFSDIKEGANVSKLTIWRCAVMVRNWLRERKCDMYACANENIEGAPRFLHRLGFVRKDSFYVMEASWQE